MRKENEIQYDPNNPAYQALKRSSEATKGQSFKEIAASARAAKAQGKWAPITDPRKIEVLRNWGAYEKADAAAQKAAHKKERVAAPQKTNKSLSKAAV